MAEGVANQTYIGNLTGAPNMRFLADGTAVTSFTIIVNSGYGDHKRADPLRITVWGKKGGSDSDQAQNCNKYLIKGQEVTVISDRAPTVGTWEYQNKQYTAVNVVARRVRFGPKPKGASQDVPPPPPNPVFDDDTLPSFAAGRRK